MSPLIHPASGTAAHGQFARPRTGPVSPEPARDLIYWGCVALQGRPVKGAPSDPQPPRYGDDGTAVVGFLADRRTFMTQARDTSTSNFATVEQQGCRGGLSRSARHDRAEGRGLLGPTRRVAAASPHVLVHR
jgi:hypothetical protein